MWWFQSEYLFQATDHISWVLVVGTFSGGEKVFFFGHELYNIGLGGPLLFVSLMIVQRKETSTFFCTWSEFYVVVPWWWTGGCYIHDETSI